jgi:hypothetical protein
MNGRWATSVLRQIRGLAAQRKVRFTLKAFQELGRPRLVSEKTGEWMYVFKPSVAEVVVYVKVVVRADCVVISFHEEEETDEDE